VVVVVLLELLLLVKMVDLVSIFLVSSVAVVAVVVTLVVLVVDQAVLVETMELVALGLVLTLVQALQHSMVDLAHKDLSLFNTIQLFLMLVRQVLVVGSLHSFNIY
jgi:hypothetical protein